MTDGFLRPASVTPEAQELFDGDVEELGFVMNASRVWAHEPSLQTGLFQLLRESVQTGGLTGRQRGILVAATASALGDSYCSLAWGKKLADASDEDTAAGVLNGSDLELDEDERVLAGWARALVRDPNGTTSHDVDRLRRVGFGDRQILAITLFVALRLAFSTVNDGLGAAPDAGFRTLAPKAVLDAVDFGRPIEPAAD